MHGGHGLKYDTDEGYPNYTTNGKTASVTFDMTNFMTKTGTRKKIVNCYDSAAAVHVMINLVGADSHYLYMKRFGYINLTQLIGRGLANNPFPEVTTAVNTGNNNDHVGLPHPNKRYPFWNHAFVELNTKIYDACVGPHKGTETRDGYVRAAIDRLPDPGPEHAAAGVVGDILGGRTVSVK